MVIENITTERHDDDDFWRWNRGGSASILCTLSLSLLTFWRERKRMIMRVCIHLIMKPISWSTLYNYL